jgi:hypothetical protein
MARVGSHAGQPACPVTEVHLPRRPVSCMTHFDPTEASVVRHDDSSRGGSPLQSAPFCHYNAVS